jgi:hypothetical protein
VAANIIVIRAASIELLMLDCYFLMLNGILSTDGAYVADITFLGFQMPYLLL